METSNKVTIRPAAISKHSCASETGALQEELRKLIDRTTTVGVTLEDRTQQAHLLHAKAVKDAKAKGLNDQTIEKLIKAGMGLAEMPTDSDLTEQRLGQIAGVNVASALEPCRVLLGIGKVLPLLATEAFNPREGQNGGMDDDDAICVK